LLPLIFSCHTLSFIFTPATLFIICLLPRAATLLRCHFRRLLIAISPRDFRRLPLAAILPLTDIFAYARSVRGATLLIFAAILSAIFAAAAAVASYAYEFITLR